MAVLALSPLGPRRAGAGSRMPLQGSGRPVFLLDAAVFPGRGDSAMVEVYWEIPYRELTFRHEEGYYRAFYDIALVLSREGRETAGDVWERRVRARSLAEVRSLEKRSQGRKRLKVPPGDYEVRVSVTDRVSHARSEARGSLEVLLPAGRIGLSDLRFVRYTGEGTVQNPGREVPVGESGYVARLTIHPGREVSGPLRVQWRFEDQFRQAILVRDSSLALAGGPVLLEIPIPSDRLSVGPNRLKVRVEELGRGRVLRREREFLARLTPQWFLLHRQDALPVLEILAMREELDSLRKASSEEWPRAVESFWRKRDPTPGTEENECRQRVLRSMEEAARLFQEPFRRPGWRTDRGRILILHGPPDRRTVREAGFDTPASEIWEYDSPHRVFLFVDERGSGEFWLRG